MADSLETYLAAAQQAGLGTDEFSPLAAARELDDLLASGVAVPDQLAPVLGRHAYQLDAVVSQHDGASVQTSTERLGLSLKLSL